MLAFNRLSWYTYYIKRKAVKVMKVFVYSKKTSKKIAEIERVGNVMECEVAEQILITTYSGETFKFNTNDVKTTAYQN